MRAFLPISARCGAAFLAICCVGGSAWALPNGVSTDDPPEFESPARPDGRVVGRKYDDPTRLSAVAGSRYETNAARGMGTAIQRGGNVPTSRFDSSTNRFGGASVPFQSKKDYSLLQRRNELKRALEAAGVPTGNGVATADGNGPRLVTATAPGRVPYRAVGSPRYGKTAEELEARRLAAARAEEARATEERLSALAEAANPNAYPAASGAAAQTIWMRGPAPVGAGRAANGGRIAPSAVPGELGFGADGTTDYDEYLRYNGLGDFGGAATAPRVPSASAAPNDGGFRSELGGSLRSGLAPIVPLTRPNASGAEALAAFQADLEEQILSSPAVGALSPVRVEYRDGVATVFGVVPTPTARANAGRILLADPRVSRVDNRMSCARSDAEAANDGLGARVDVRPLPTTDSPATPNDANRIPIPNPNPNPNDEPAPALGAPIDLTSTPSAANAPVAEPVPVAPQPISIPDEAPLGE